MDSEGGSPLMMSRKDMSVMVKQIFVTALVLWWSKFDPNPANMSPLVRSCQNGSVSEVFFARNNSLLKRHKAVESDDDEQNENDPFTQLASKPINSRKRPLLQSQSTFEIICNTGKHSRPNGTTPKRLTTDNDMALKLNNQRIDDRIGDMSTKHALPVVLGPRDKPGSKTEILNLNFYRPFWSICSSSILTSKRWRELWTRALAKLSAEYSLLMPGMDTSSREAIYVELSIFRLK